MWVVTSTSTFLANPSATRDEMLPRKPIEKKDD